MAKFTVGVELHDAEPEDYERLHELMENAGFSRTIRASNGTLYQLPTAEYNVEGNYDIDGVLRSAVSAANLTGRNHGILVTESAGRKWQGLVRA